jgi:hypothetical protein
LYLGLDRVHENFAIVLEVLYISLQSGGESGVNRRVHGAFHHKKGPFMNRISRLGRLAAAAVLVASGATVALATPAGAANTAINLDCTQPATQQSIGNSDTLTVTISGNLCVSLVFDNPGSGQFGTATVNGITLSPGSSSVVVSGDVLVYTAPASGAGSNSFSFWPNQNPPPAGFLTISFGVPPTTTTTTTTSTTTAGTVPVVPAFTG